MEPIKPDDMAESVIGLSEDEATKRLNAQGYHARVVNRDGKSFAVTLDLKPNRVRLQVKDGRVVKAYIG